MAKTIDNLKAAFAGESQASRRYLAFAKKADEEGYPQIAKLFRAAAAAETIHAHNHLRLFGLGSTAENLKTAISGENYEVQSMYPEFISAAEQEMEKKALTSFRWAMEVEKVHAGLYSAALAGLEDQAAKTAGADYYVCPFCGYTHEGTPPEKCPVCGTPGKKFERIQ
jgi:rubrerythrin